MIPPLLRIARAMVAPAALAVLAAVQLDGIPVEGLGNLGLVAALAVLIGRYTFRQLENYRTDLRGARDRIDELEDDLHAQGKSKAETERRLREVEDYAHRLRLWALAQGMRAEELPPPPEAPA